MKISYNWLQSFFDPPSHKASEGQGKKLPKPEKLADLLTMHSFEVEEVGKRGDDYILDIDILPNRAHDCLSHLGVARECAALLKLKISSYEGSPAGRKINQYKAKFGERFCETENG